MSDMLKSINGFDVAYLYLFGVILYFSYLYRIRYVDMKTCYGNRCWVVFLLWMLLSTALIAFLTWCRSRFTTHVFHDMYIWTHAFLVMLNWTMGFKVYRMFGGMDYKCFLEMLRTFVVSAQTGNWKMLKDDEFSLFSVSRVIEYAKSTNGNGKIKNKLQVILNLIDTITLKLECYVGEIRQWRTYTGSDADVFLNELGMVTKRYYGLMHHVKISGPEVDAFYSILNTLTPAYDDELKLILTDADYADRQRREKVVDALYRFGEEIKREVAGMVAFNEDGRNGK